MPLGHVLRERSVEVRGMGVFSEVHPMGRRARILLASRDRLTQAKHVDDNIASKGLTQANTDRSCDIGMFVHVGLTQANDLTQMA